MPKVTVVGVTSWGTTLGVILARKKLKVQMLARTEQESELLSKNRFASFLPAEIDFPSDLSVTGDPSVALSDSKAVIMAVPSQSMRHNINLIKAHFNKSMIICTAAKGLEIGSNKRMSEVIAEEIDPRFRTNICVLSGPNLAREILTGLPAATVAAAENDETARMAQRILTCPTLCVFTHHDTIGVELGGALKNIIALGAGMADGLEYGDNAKSAFITRGLTEMTALGVALGANPLTFSGLAGLGDLIATCASKLSRNHYVGEQLAKGRKLDEILNSMDGVAEGVSTTLVAWKLAHKMGLEMPITDKIHEVLYCGASPKQAAAALMGAQVNHELTGRKWKLFSFLRRQKRP